MQNKSGSESEITRLRGDLLTVASRVSHDFRTPMGSIVTATEVLKETLTENNLPVALTQTVFDSVDELTHQIKQISFITRATADPLPKKPVPMDGVLALVLQRLERQILERQAAVSKPDSWPRVNGVAIWLEEVWWNFLANALEHTGDKPRIEFNWKKEGHHYRFEISDNGPGVREDIRKKLFRPFHLLHKSDSPPGFGLAIVQRLVDLQGGDCGYEPRGDGSCFYFTLPV